MGFDYSKTDREIEEKMPSRLVFLPKVGEQWSGKIVKVSRMEHPKLNITVDRERTLEDGSTVRETKNLGFYIGCTLTTEQTLVVNSFAGYKLFRDKGVTDGHEIVVKHPSRGNWEIEILNAE